MKFTTSVDADQSFMIDRTDTTLDLSYISRELLKKEGVYSGGWLRARVGKQTLKNVFYIYSSLLCCIFCSLLLPLLLRIVIISGSNGIAIVNE